jgi:DNA (cytosine-5)-methyltransferase 1
MFRVISEAKPTWVLGENVAGIVNMELDNVLSDLESIGYSAWPIVIPACAVDAKHRRDRVWIIAHSESTKRELSRDSRPGRNGFTDSRENVAEADFPSGKGNERAERSETERADCQQPHRWPTESGFCRVANGIPNRSHRLKGLGNAIVPQVAEQIIRAMIQTEI